MDACLENEMPRTLYAADTLAPTQDVSRRENLQPNILAPAKGQHFLRYTNSFTFSSPKFPFKALFSALLHLNVSEECQYFWSLERQLKGSVNIFSLTKL